MARTFNGTNYLQSSNPDLSNGFTINAWVKLSSAAANGAVVTLHSATGTLDYYMLFNNPAGNRVRFGMRATGQSFVAADTVGGGTVGIWEMWTGWSAANQTDFGVSLNATNSDTGTALRTPTIDEMSIGILGDDSLNNGLLGDIAEVAVYNTVLTLEDRIALYNNGTPTDPRMVRPDALIWHDPLYGGAPYLNRRGNQHDMAEFAGAAPAAEHPPIRLIFPVLWQPPTSAVGPLIANSTGTFESNADGEITELHIGSSTGTFESNADGEIQELFLASSTGTFESNSAGDIIGTEIARSTGTFESNASGAISEAGVQTANSTGTFESNAAGEITELALLVATSTGTFESTAAGDIVGDKIANSTGTFESTAAGDVREVVTGVEADHICIVRADSRVCIVYE